VKYGVRESDCISCSLGQFCGSINLTSPTGDCDPGFYCLRGNREPNPTGMTRKHCIYNVHPLKSTSHFIQAMNQTLVVHVRSAITAQPALHTHWHAKLERITISPDKPIALNVQVATTVQKTLPRTKSSLVTRVMCVPRAPSMPQSIHAPWEPTETIQWDSLWTTAMFVLVDGIVGRRDSVGPLISAIQVRKY
jgi:hypothetical protein